MIVLFFGDIVGAEAASYLAERIPAMRSTYDADLVIANAENSAANGLGPGIEQVELLLDNGVDVITGGNHSWDSDEAVKLLGHPAVLRPSNLDPDVAGRGVLHTRAAGTEVTVINLADACAMRSVRATAGKFRPAYEGWLRAPRRGTVLVDYHGDHVLEKQIFARTVDGEAAAVLGTHTHEPTTPLHLLPGGTALVTDVGMTGATSGVQGFQYDSFVTGLRTTGDPFSLPLPSPVSGPIVIGGVVLEIEDGRTRRLERLT